MLSMCSTESSPYIRKSRLLRFLSPICGREPITAEVVPLEATLISKFGIFSNPIPSPVIFISKNLFRWFSNANSQMTVSILRLQTVNVSIFNKCLNTKTRNINIIQIIIYIKINTNFILKTHLL